MDIALGFAIGFLAGSVYVMFVLPWLYDRLGN
jgi:hypothetical protein